MLHVRALVEVTAGRSGGRPALPMIPGQTMPIAHAADALLTENRRAIIPAYDGTIFELTDEPNPAPEPD